jgi:hypothetical protein
MALGLILLRPREQGLTPLVTLLANAHTGAANAAEGETRGCGERGSVNQATTRTSVMATAIRIGCRPVFA